MPAIHAHFSDIEIQPIKSGIRTFIRLTGMIADEHQYRWFADEADAVSALNSIKRTFKRTEDMIGKMKYQGQSFDATRQVREDIAASMLTGHTEMATVANGKRYSPLFYLIIEPTINLFGKFDHETALSLVDEIVDDVIRMVEECTAYGTYDDALIAQAMTKKLIRDREEAQKLVKTSRKRKKKEVETNFFEADAEVIDENSEEVDAEA